MKILRGWLSGVDKRFDIGLYNKADGGMATESDSNRGQAKKQIYH